MSVEIVHAGFDGLRVNVESLISSEVRSELNRAKEMALSLKSAVPVTINGMEFAVRHTGNRAFSLHTGEYGAEFYVHDPEYKDCVGPGVKMDFRAFFLATEGLVGARIYFQKAMTALEVSTHQDHMMVSRVDFAVDFLAPQFVPDVDALVLPARTSKREFREADTSQRFFANTEVTGITCGHVSNRQLVIYDKRAEVLAKRKPGWLEIWNATRARAGHAPFDLSDRKQSKVWRFENRVGSKCLRRRWEIRCWDDLDAMIGDVFSESLEKMRYTEPQRDSNRSRWPDHQIWSQLKCIVGKSLASYCSGVIPDAVKQVNRAEHMRMTDQNITGNLIARAVASGVKPENFWGFARSHIEELKRLSERHAHTLDERFAKTEGRYKFR